MKKASAHAAAVMLPESFEAPGPRGQAEQGWAAASWPFEVASLCGHLAAPQPHWQQWLGGDSFKAWNLFQMMWAHQNAVAES